MKEWIVTNGIGGYAASTDFGGMNTRKYHGLLIAALNPPSDRTLILSKLDESIEINGKKRIYIQMMLMEKFLKDTNTRQILRKT